MFCNAKHLRRSLDVGEEQRGERDSHRVVAAQQRDCDAREPERGRELLVVAVELRITEERADGHKASEPAD